MITRSMQKCQDNVLGCCALSMSQSEPNGSATAPLKMFGQLLNENL